MCWNWETTGEVIKTVAPVVTAGVACFGAYIALRGLTKWREETLGKRKADLAEEVLAGFLQMRDVIDEARSAGSFWSEAQGRTPWPEETERQTNVRATYFVPIARLLRHTELISGLEAKKYRMIALFGTGVDAPFDQLFGVVRKIHGTARMMMRSINADGYREGDAELWKKWDATIWSGLEETDSFAAKVDEAITKIEAICRPVLTGKNQ